MTTLSHAYHMVMHGSSKGTRGSRGTGRRYMRPTRTYANCRGGASQGLAQLTLRFIGATNLRNGPVVTDRSINRGDAFPINWSRPVMDEAWVIGRVGNI